MAREVLTDYLEAVGSQIRWRRARGPLLRELSDHIDDQAAALREQGAEEAAALAAAVAEMGDPAQVGQALDRLHRPHDRWGIAGAVALLGAAGLVFQFLLARAVPSAGDPWYLLLRHGATVLLGLGAMAALWFGDVTLLLRRRALPGLALALLTVLGVLLCLVSPVQSGGRLHLWGLYPLLLLPIPYAALLLGQKGRGPLAAALWGLLPPLLPLAALMLPSLSAFLVCWASMLLTLAAAVGIGWFRGKRLPALGAALLPSAALAALALWSVGSSVYISGRLAAFRDPLSDPMGAGWMYLRLRAGEALTPHLQNSADLLLVNLRQLLGPWVLPVLAAALVLAALLVLRRVLTLSSRAGRLTALAALLPLLLQGVLYWLFNLGWSPVGALSLPFLSSGGGFLLTGGIQMGVVLSVLRMDDLIRDPAETRRPRGEGGLSLSLLGGRLRMEYRPRT